MPLVDHARPSLAVDPAVLRVADGRLTVYLWRRDREPQAGAWALPGVFVHAGESFEDAVGRAIETKLRLPAPGTPMVQLFAWNKDDRDERGWVVTVAYMVVAPDAPAGHLVEDDDGPRAQAFTLEASGGTRTPVAVTARDLRGAPVRLAFDHADVLRTVVERLRADLWRTDVALRFLPDRFTLRALQSVYEAILGETVNKDSFRRRVVQTLELVAPTGDREANVDHRPAELYRAADAR